MRLVNTVRADSPEQLAERMTPFASGEFLAGRAGQPSAASAGQPQIPVELWLLAVQRVSADPGEWTIYGLSSDEDIPGWPHQTGTYTGGLRHPRQVGAALAAAGYQVVMRHYTSFTVTCVSDDVPLT
ncbi:hypothetical protein [Kitasatospora sp. NPDC127116]|uniref:hypothetical protein n=1 Tax=Kitasatospora sp. NPDC127116 TaxID=3345367 RepID=UPI00363DFC1F